MNNLEVGPACDKRMGVIDAWLYCQTLNFNGHKDWRMPTYDERMDLADYCNIYGTWDSDDIPSQFASDYLTLVFPVRDVND